MASFKPVLKGGWRYCNFYPKEWVSIPCREKAWLDSATQTFLLFSWYSDWKIKSDFAAIDCWTTVTTQFWKSVSIFYIINCKIRSAYVLVWLTSVTLFYLLKQATLRKVYLSKVVTRWLYYWSWIKKYMQ